MKLISVAVVLALVTLPALARVSYVVFRLLRRGVRGADGLSEPPPKVERFISRYRVLLYLASSSYVFVLLAAFFWMVHELAPNRFDAVQVAAGASLMVIAAAAGLPFFLSQRRMILQKVPPPPAGSSDDLLLEWRLAVSNELADRSLRVVGRAVLIGLAIVVVWAGSLLLLVHPFS
jgi:hypothetical protein